MEEQRNGEPDGSALMHVAFTPVWVKNPFHAELTRAVASEGVRVEHIAGFEELHARLRRDPGLRELRVVHLHGLPYFKWRPKALRRYLSFVADVLWMRRRGIRIMWTVHDLQNHDNPNEWSERCARRLVVRLIDALIAMGENARNAVIDDLGAATARKVHVIPHGNTVGVYPNTVSRAEARRLLGIAPEKRVLLFFGAIRPYKGLSEFIRIFRRHCGQDMQLVIAGRPFSKKIDAQVKAEAGNDPRIIYHPGFAKDEDVQTYMNAADMVVMPYLANFTSGAAILAMSFGKACLAPRAGGVPDALDSSGAVFFDQEDEGSLERAFLEVLQGKHDLEKMGTHNRTRAEKLDWREIGRKTATLYRDLALWRPTQRAG